MTCIILAAGYATRLYPLTLNVPKPLLPVGGKSILDWLMDDIRESGSVDRYILVSNHLFHRQFREWAGRREESIAILDDGTTCNEGRLGAVKDLRLAIDTLKEPTDLLVMAGDNLLDHSLSPFLAYGAQKGYSCLMRYWEEDEDRLRRTGVVEVDGEDRVLSMEEKPEKPKSFWCCPPFYYYCALDLPLVAEAVNSGTCNTDAPGSFIAWLARRRPVYAMKMAGRRYDIGDWESYALVQQIFSRA